MAHLSVYCTFLKKCHISPKMSHLFYFCTSKSCIFIQIKYIYREAIWKFLILITFSYWNWPQYILTYVYGDFYARGRAAMLFSVVYGGRLVESYNSCLVDRSLSQEWGQFRDFWQFLKHSVRSCFMSRKFYFHSELR